MSEKTPPPKKTEKTPRVLPKDFGLLQLFGQDLTKMAFKHFYIRFNLAQAILTNLNNSLKIVR